MLTYTCHERTVVFWSPFFDSSNWTSTSAGKTRSKLKIKLQPFVVSCFKRFSIEYQNIFSTVKKNDDSPFFPPQEEKKSLKERLQAIQEVTQTVQNSIGYIASLCERVKNLFNFTVPYLSYLAMILAILGAVVLYFIPLRYLILTWGVNKFSRKIVRPHSVPNNELLDLISRVPDDEELLNYRFLSLRTKSRRGATIRIVSIHLVFNLQGVETVADRRLRERIWKSRRLESNEEGAEEEAQGRVAACPAAGSRGSTITEHPEDGPAAPE